LKRRLKQTYITTGLAMIRIVSAVLIFLPQVSLSFQLGRLFINARLKEKRPAERT
jgi:hypothetical protein